MASGNFPIHVWNRGRISKLALARTDVERVKISAERQTNWIPRTIGSMMLRPGTKYIGTINNSSTAILIPFVFASSYTALIELTSGTMQVWVNDAKITRTASTAAITNGTFSSSALTGWTDADESGGISDWDSSGPYLLLRGNRYARAKRRQAVTASSGTHGLAVTINRGHVYLRVGSSAGGDDYFAEANLGPGAYSLGILSTGTFNIELSANTEYDSRVTSLSIESSGVMSIASPWLGSALASLRWDQSADVVYVAAHGYQQRKIARYSSDSWGVTVYEPEDGPFFGPNLTRNRLTASGLVGSRTLAADRPFFAAGHVGAIFRHTSLGQDVSLAISASDQTSNAIRVAGIGGSRIFQITLYGASSVASNFQLQSSPGTSDSFANVTGGQYSLNAGETSGITYNDTFDNQIIWYRMISGAYLGGTPQIALHYPGGGLTGYARITSVTAATLANIDILTNIGSTAATEIWEEGLWSTARGWPSAVALHEGRLWWSGKSRIVGSIADGYESFDPDYPGDAGPINRTIASGGVERTQWLASLGRLIVGCDTREIQAKTGSLDEPLTPSNFNLRDVSGQGSANVPALKIDKRLLFIQKNQTRLMEMGYSGESLDYETADRTVLVPEIGEPSITRIGIQRQPDTRIHAVRSDGTVGLLISEPAEAVSGWVDVESSGGVGGAIEDVAVLPSTNEDAVYYIVRREINGSTKRYLEKWSLEAQARGGSSNRLADCHLVQNSTATTAITGLDHLVGSSVIAWGATADLGSYTVSTTGTITLTQASTTTVVGLPYSAVYISNKLAYAASPGNTALTQKKRVSHVGLIMADVHAQGLQIGPSTATLNLLPRVEAGVAVSTDVVNAAYDHQSIELPGQWDTDSRLVLVATAPRPVTVLGAVITVHTREKGG